MSDISFNFFPSNAAASIVGIENVPAPSGVGGLFIPQKVAVFGQYDATKTGVTNYTPVQVLSVDGAGNTFGFGSMLHMQIRKLEKALLAGVEIWAFPIPEEAGGTQSAGTYTITGTATSAGTLFLYIAGQKVEIAVASGDDGDAIAITAAAAINALLNVPVTAAVNGVTAD